MTADLNHTDVVNTTISVAAHLEDELDEALAEHRLTRPSFLVLDALERAEGQTSGTSASSWPTASAGPPGRSRFAWVGSSGRGVIEREPDPDNRRSVTVTLTDRGRALVEARAAGVRRACRSG